MSYFQITQGLTLTIPQNGTTNWGTTVANTTWTKISAHNHTGSGNGSLIPTAGLSDNAVTKAKLALNIGVHQAALVTPAGTTQTLNFNLGNIQRISLASATGDVTLTLSNPIEGGIYLIQVTQGATPRDLIWPASVKWPQAQKPILSTSNGQIDLVSLMYNGTNYLGSWDLNYS